MICIFFRIDGAGMISQLLGSWNKNKNNFYYSYKYKSKHKYINIGSEVFWKIGKNKVLNQTVWENNLLREFFLIDLFNLFLII